MQDNDRMDPAAAAEYASEVPPEGGLAAEAAATVARAKKRDTPDLSGWNWGAFLLTWIWGIGNDAPAAFRIFIPLYNIYWWFALGARGNRLAWKSGRWTSVAEFRRAQRRWTFIAFGVYFAFAALVVGVTWGIPSMMRSSPVWQMSMQQLRASEAAMARLGAPVEDGLIFSGSISTKGETGEATLDIPVSGPHGAGTLHAAGEKSLGQWILTGLVLEMEDGEKVTLIVPRAERRRDRTQELE